MDWKANAKEEEKTTHRFSTHPDVETEVGIQCTMSGLVSTKARRLEDDSIDESKDTSNTLKEELCLQYLANFQEHFQHVFPTRRPLYLHPVNEKGVPKFVCTTLRPTLLPYRDLYEWQALARFLAGMIEYEPLALPTSPPSCLPSPSFTLKWKAGDSFDLATLLVSFLLGAGYDAYVVYGLAPRWLCLVDQSKVPLPVIPIEKDVNQSQAQQVVNANEPTDKEEGPCHGKLISRTTFASKYMKKQELEMKKQLETPPRDPFNVRYDEQDKEEEEEEEEDPLEGKRVHAWVLVRAGKREIADSFYLEPSTGCRYSLSDSPYLSIESVWNHENYWVNMQHEAISQTRLELSNPTDWEYVFLSTDSKVSNEDKSTTFPTLITDNTNGSRAEAKNEELLLEIPPSWVAKLHLDRKTYRQKFVNHSQRVTFYNRAKVEEFADNTHDQGLITRITRFRDVGCTLPIEIREYFKNRKDKLVFRRRLPFEGTFEERFQPGRAPEALQSRTEVMGYRREHWFDPNARSDGLVQRLEELQKRIVEYYANRDDALVSRSVTLATDKDDVNVRNPYILPGGPAGELAIKKMKETFARNPARRTEDDQYQRIYHVQEGTITVNFHYATGKITAASRVYSKAPNVPVAVVMADPNAKKPKLSILEEELRAAFQMEKDCYSAVRHSYIETQDIVKCRTREEQLIVLDTSIFDQTNEEETVRKEKKDAQELEKSLENKVDYLSPFLHSLHATSGTLSKEDAQAVRDLCLRSLKERLLLRANIIQGRLDKENALLAKRQAAFQRSQRDQHQDPDPEFERFCSETMFRIQILEHRLASHEEMALHKYAEMDKRLHNDRRLLVLHG